MKKVNKRIHGKLLIASGIFHTLIAFVPGIFGTQMLGFAKSGFFNISKGIADFPIFGGTLDYVTFATFWFFYAGPLFIIYGQVIDTVERVSTSIPRQIAISFLIVSLIGAYMAPFSGMTILLVPQAIYMLKRSQKVV